MNPQPQSTKEDVPPSPSSSSSADESAAAGAAIVAVPAATTTATAPSMLVSLVTLETAVRAASLVVPAVSVLAPALLALRAERPATTTTVAATGTGAVTNINTAAEATANTTTTTTTTLPPAQPLPPQPKAGDLVVWISKAAAARQQRAQQEQEARADEEGENNKKQKRGEQEECQQELEGILTAAVLDGGNLWKQTLTLSRYAPRLSSGGGHGAPSYEAQSPPVPLGVCVMDGKWMFHNGKEGEEATIFIVDLPDPLATRHLGQLVILRAAEEEDVDEILLRTMQCPGVHRYEVVESDGVSGSAELSSFSPLPLPEMATAANAHYACWSTSVAGAHLRTPIEQGPLYHHCIDSGEGTIIHYSGGEVRLDPLYVLLSKDLAPHRLVTVNNASRLQTETEIVEALGRAMGRLGERNYCVIKNNCEHLANWATMETHVSSQVSQGSIGLGCVLGSLGAFALGCASAPVWALPLLGISGAAIGSFVVHGAVTHASSKMVTYGSVMTPTTAAAADAAAAAAAVPVAAGAQPAPLPTLIDLTTEGDVEEEEEEEGNKVSDEVEEDNKSDYVMVNASEASEDEPILPSPSSCLPLMTR